MAREGGCKGDGYRVLRRREAWAVQEVSVSVNLWSDLWFLT
jgi:hypothetical protein